MHVVNVFYVFQVHFTSVTNKLFNWSFGVVSP